MSLSDTAFIFVLALIIFGPKKLPEIGRQIGRLVGEFRRASNEFKFQIEEELRQVDLQEQRKAEPQIAPPQQPVSLPEDSEVSVQAEAAASMHEAQFTENDPAELPLETQLQNSEVFEESSEPVSHPTLTPAEGTQARTTVPYSPSQPSDGPLQEAITESNTHSSSSDLATASNRLDVPSSAQADNDDLSPAPASALSHNASGQPGSTEANVNHG